MITSQITEKIQLIKNYGYDFINIININQTIDQQGYDLEEKISNKKTISQIHIIAIKNYYICNVILSQSILEQMENIVKFIEKNSVYNKKLSLYYKKIYLEDSYKINKTNHIIKNKNFKAKNNIPLPKKIKQEYGYESLSVMTSYIKTNIVVTNSFKTKKTINHSNTYTEGLLKTNEDILIFYNSKFERIDLEKRFIFYKNKFIKIPYLSGKVKFSGYIIANLLKQLLNIFSSEAISSNTTFIKTNHFGKKIFPTYIDIIDYPNCKKFNDNIPFDYNGIQTRKKFIVRKGILFELFGDINSNLRNGMGSPGNYYKKTSDLTNGLITFSNIILNIGKTSKYKEYSYEIKEFSLDTILNIQTGIISGSCYGFLIGNDVEKPILCEINIDIIKFFNKIQSISQNKIYDNICCPDIIVEYEEVNNG